MDIFWNCTMLSGATERVSKLEAHGGIDVGSLEFPQKCYDRLHLSLNA